MLFQKPNSVLTTVEKQVVYLFAMHFDHCTLNFCIKYDKHMQIQL